MNTLIYLTLKTITMENSFSPSPDDEIRTENEVKKLRLELEFDGNFSKMSDELTPELEQAFLNHVIHFEENYKNAGQCTIYEKLGCPHIRETDTIPDSEIEQEYRNLLGLLNAKGIDFDACATYENSSRLFHAFITQELFPVITTDYLIAGGMQCFIYEEFVPNHLYDINQLFERIIDFLLVSNNRNENRIDSFYFKTADMISVDSNAIDNESISVTEFFVSFPLTAVQSVSEPVFTFSVYPDCKPGEIEGIANATFTIQYSRTNKLGETEYFTGAGEINFELQWNCWIGTMVDLPGLRIPSF